MPNFAPSGIPRLGEVAWGSHFCHFYRSRAELEDALVGFFAAGLENGERCLWMTSSFLPAHEAEAALRARVPAAGAALRDGRIEIVDRLVWSRRHGADSDAAVEVWLEQATRTLEAGYRGLRLSGDTHGIDRDAWKPFMAYEGRAQEAFHRHRIVALCTYGLCRCDAAEVLEVVDRHEFALVSRDGRLDMVQGGSVAATKEVLRRMNRELEARVRARTEALRAEVRARDELLAMLGHELRNPLGAVRVAASMARELRAEATEARVVDDLLAVIDRQSETLARLVDDILDVGRVTRGAVELSRRRVRVAEVVESAVEAARPSTERRGQHLEVGPVPEVSVDGDPVRLVQVLGNLLDNASKYTPERGRIDVEAREEAGEVVLTVRDTGRGIAAAALPRLFDLFVQSARPLHRPGGGLGLGLALVRALVEMHGGRVEGRSEGEGFGSEFEVRLPLVFSTAAEGSVAEDRRTAHPCRVLVAEDQPDLAESLRLLLRMRGHEVECAADGPGALEAAARFRPDVVLLDIGLPGLDGLEVARRLRAREQDGGPTLVALSGYREDQLGGQLEEAGFDRYALKPLAPSALDEILATVPRRSPRPAG